MNSFKVGANVDAWCTKCKFVLAHTIEAVVETTIKRVQCNTCKGKHQFKANEPGTKKSGAAKAKQLQTAKTKSKASDFSRLLGKKDITKACGYKVSHQFSKGDVMSHATFGLGIVVDKRDASKIEVLFETGPKILVHARM